MAQSLSATALRLAEDSPDAGLFDEVLEYGGRIEEMRDAALLANAASTTDAQIGQFAALLKESFGRRSLARNPRGGNPLELAQGLRAGSERRDGRSQGGA